MRLPANLQNTAVSIVFITRFDQNSPRIRSATTAILSHRTIGEVSTCQYPITSMKPNSNARRGCARWRELTEGSNSCPETLSIPEESRAAAGGRRQVYSTFIWYIGVVPPDSNRKTALFLFSPASRCFALALAPFGWPYHT